MYKSSAQQPSKHSLRFNETSPPKKSRDEVIENLLSIAYQVAEFRTSNGRNLNSIITDLNKSLGQSDYFLIKGRPDEDVKLIKNLIVHLN